MHGADRILRALLLFIALLLAMIAARPYFVPDMAVIGDSGRFDHLNVVSPAYIYNGSQGVLLLDKRNGNVWFLRKNIDNLKVTFGDPEFVAHVPLEKIGEAANR